MNKTNAFPNVPIYLLQLICGVNVLTYSKINESIKSRVKKHIQFYNTYFLEGKKIRENYLLTERKRLQHSSKVPIKNNKRKTF